VIVFPKAYEKYGHLLTVENVVFIKGTVNVKDEDSIKILLNDAQSVLQNSEFINTKRKGESKLYLKVDSINSPIVQEIIDVLKDFSGETNVIFFDASTKKYSKR
jgi:DNA polymerase-3 subunit alpha